MCASSVTQEISESYQLPPPSVTLQKIIIRQVISGRDWVVVHSWWPAVGKPFHLLTLISKSTFCHVNHQSQAVLFNFLHSQLLVLGLEFIWEISWTRIATLLEFCERRWSRWRKPKNRETSDTAGHSDLELIEKHTKERTSFPHFHYISCLRCFSFIKGCAIPWQFLLAFLCSSFVFFIFIVSLFFLQVFSFRKTFFQFCLFASLPRTFISMISLLFLSFIFLPFMPLQFHFSVFLLDFSEGNYRKCERQH